MFKKCTFLLRQCLTHVMKIPHWLCKKKVIPYFKNVIETCFLSRFLNNHLEDFLLGLKHFFFRICFVPSITHRCRSFLSKIHSRALRVGGPRVIFWNMHTSTLITKYHDSSEFVEKPSYKNFRTKTFFARKIREKTPPPFKLGRVTYKSVGPSDPTRYGSGDDSSHSTVSMKFVFLKT